MPRFIGYPNRRVIAVFDDAAAVAAAVASLRGAGIAPDDIERFAGADDARRFDATGWSGAAHRDRATGRLHAWFDDKVAHGFSEWHSDAYLGKDLAPLLALAELSSDRAVAARATAFADLAPQVIGHARLPESLAQRHDYYRRMLEREIGAAVASGSGALAPTTLVADRMDLDLGGGRVLVLHAHRPAHTDHDLSLLDRATGPLLEVAGKLHGGRVPPICSGLHDYFRDVYDHLVRLKQSIENLREMAATVMSVNLSLITINENEVTKRLAAYAALVAVPTMIAGVYGMNFSNMPELSWRWGYPVALGSMVLIDIYLVYRFKKAGWF